MRNNTLLIATATVALVGFNFTATSAVARSKARHTLVGHWKGSDRVDYVFKGDGTFESSLVHYSASVKSMAVKGTYKFSGDKVSVTFNSIFVNAADPSKQAAMNNAARSYLKAMKPEWNKVEWKSDDEVLLFQTKSHPVILKRV